MHDKTLSCTLPWTLLALILAPGCLDPETGGVDGATSGELPSTTSTSTSDADAWPPTHTTTVGTSDTDADTDSPVVGEAPECEVGAEALCPYGGPEGTAGIGACQQGTRVCGEDQKWSACVGEVLPVTEDCGTEVDENCDGEVGCTGEIEWVRGFGEQFGDTPGKLYVNGATVDGAGDVWITGDFRESLQLGEDVWDVGDQRAYFMAQVDARGEAVFSFGDEQDGALATGAAMAASGDGTIAVAAILQGKLKLAEAAPSYQTAAMSPATAVALLGEDGEYRVSRLMAPSHLGSVRITSLAFGGEGQLWAAGDFRGDHAFIETGAGTLTLANQGERDALLVRIEPDGQVSRARSFGAAGRQVVYGIAVDGAGDVWLAGEFDGSLGYEGGALHAWADAGKPDMFVVKLDPDGTWKWGRAYGGPGTQRFIRLQVDHEGNGVVAGEYDGESLALGTTKLSNDEGLGAQVVVKIDPTGKTLWAQSWPCDKFCGINEVVIDGAGQVVVSAYVLEGRLSIDGQHFEVVDQSELVTVLVKLDRDGHPVWPARSLPANMRAVVGQAGQIYLAGMYRGAVSFGPASDLQLDAGADDDDIVVARLRP